MKTLRTVVLYLIAVAILFLGSSFITGYYAFAGTFPSEKPIYEGGGETVVPECDLGEVAWIVFTPSLDTPTDQGLCGGSFDPDVSYFDLGGPPLPMEIQFCNEAITDLGGGDYECGDISNTVSFDLVCGTYDEAQCAVSGAPSIWGEGNNGFWGAGFTAIDLKDQVAGAVGATGNNIYPLLIFVGIPLAFLIFLAVMNFIRQGVPEQKTFNAKRFNKKADELGEFYSRRSRAKAPEGTNWDRT